MRAYVPNMVAKAEHCPSAAKQSCYRLLGALQSVFDARRRTKAEHSTRFAPSPPGEC